MQDRGAPGSRLNKLGRYEVLNELGKGAMGIVYLAKDPLIGRMVAIKTIRVSTMGDDDSESREFRERFVREAQTAGILSHPNIVTIHDIGEDPDTQTSFIAMEYIEGRNLKSLLAERNRFAYEQIADIIAQVGEAIDYAHRKGIIHRDIKPANIIITTDSKVKIMDFGIAKIASSNLTTTGQFLGTPNYMSPEQVSGAPVDGRSDIFSLGVVLYELLTNRKPFQGENLTAISYKIVHEEFTPPADLSRDVPSDFNPIVARAMAKDPWNRYQRGKDFALALHQLKARLEEQKALHDLGNMVSAAENMPTLRLENLDRLVAEASAEHGAPAGAAKPEDVSDWTEDSGALFPRTPPPAAVPEAWGPGAARAPNETNPGLGAWPPIPEGNVSGTLAISREGGSAGLAAAPPAATSRPPVEHRGDASDSERPTSAISRKRAAADQPAPAAPAPAAPRRVTPSPSAPAGPMVVRTLEVWHRLVDRDWKTVIKRRVNPPWFWGVSAAGALFFVILIAALAARTAMVSRPTSPVDPAMERATRDKKKSLEEAKRLFAAGQYEPSLKLLRGVLARSPGNEQARHYAQMAENALQGRAEDVLRSQQAEEALRLARVAFDEKNYEQAVRHADEALLLDGGKLEAQKIKEDASSRVSEVQLAATEAARKKKVKDLAARRQPPSSGPVRAEGPAPAGAPAAAPPSSTASAAPGALRLLFDSPISEGHVMIAVNDQILLRKQFSFKRKDGLFKTIRETGTVSASMPVQPGPISVKAWLSGPGISPAFATTSAQIAGGETKTLQLEFSAGRLSVQVR